MYRLIAKNKMKQGFLKHFGKIVVLIVLFISGGNENSSVCGQELERTQNIKKKWGFVDKASGEVVIPFIYKNAGKFSEGLAAVQHGNKWGFIDKTGEAVIPFRFENVRNFSEGLAAVQHDNKWGFIDKTGEVVIPFNYTNAMMFYYGLALANSNNKWGYIDNTDKVEVPFVYNSLKKVKEVERTILAEAVEILTIEIEEIVRLRMERYSNCQKINLTN